MYSAFTEYSTSYLKVRNPRYSYSYSYSYSGFRFEYCTRVLLSTQYLIATLNVNLYIGRLTVISGKPIWFVRVKGLMRLDGLSSVFR